MRSVTSENFYRAKIEYKGKPVFLITLDEEFNCELKVVQPEPNSDLIARLEALEKEILKPLI